MELLRNSKDKKAKKLTKKRVSREPWSSIIDYSHRPDLSLCHRLALRLLFVY